MVNSWGQLCSIKQNKHNKIYNFMCRVNEAFTLLRKMSLNFNLVYDKYCGRELCVYHFNWLRLVLMISLGVSNKNKYTDVFKDTSNPASEFKKFSSESHLVKLHPFTKTTSHAFIKPNTSTLPTCEFQAWYDTNDAKGTT